MEVISFDIGSKEDWCELLFSLEDALEYKQIRFVKTYNYLDIILLNTNLITDLANLISTYCTEHYVIHCQSKMLCSLSETNDDEFILRKHIRLYDKQFFDFILICGYRNNVHRNFVNEIRMSNRILQTTNFGKCIPEQEVKYFDTFWDTFWDASDNYYNVPGTLNSNVSYDKKTGISFITNTTYLEQIPISLHTISKQIVCFQAYENILAMITLMQECVPPIMNKLMDKLRNEPTGFYSEKICSVHSLESASYPEMNIVKID